MGRRGKAEGKMQNPPALQFSGFGCATEVSAGGIERRYEDCNQFRGLTMYCSSVILVRLSRVDQKFNPVDAFIRFLQHGPHFGDKVGPGFRPLRSSVVCSDRCSSTQELAAQNSAGFILWQSLAEPNCSECEFLRASNEVLALHALHSAFLLLPSKF